MRQSIWKKFRCYPCSDRIKRIGAYSARIYFTTQIIYGILPVVNLIHLTHNFMAKGNNAQKRDKKKPKKNKK